MRNLLNILFLDDDPNRTKRFKKDVPEAITVETVKECIEELKTETWDWVFLDHDLGGETYVKSSSKKCGMEVVRWILKNQNIVSVKRFIVHSHNVDAGKEMKAKLSEQKFNVEYIPFMYLWDWNVIKYIQELGQ